MFSSLHEKNAVLHHLKFLRKFYPKKICPIHAVQPIFHLLPPTNIVCEGYVFTLCVSVHGWGRVCLSACWDTTTTPPLEQTHTPLADTPAWSRHSLPPGTRHPPPCEQAPLLGPGTPWDQADPPRTSYPHAQCMLGNTVNKRAVCILLECNLVLKIISLITMNKTVHKCLREKRREGIQDYFKSMVGDFYYSSQWSSKLKLIFQTTQGLRGRLLHVYSGVKEGWWCLLRR